MLRPSKWSLCFLLFPVVYSLFLFACTELFLLLHLTELTVHVICLHASTICAITINISTMKTDTICSSEAPVCTYKSVWYHNTMTENRIHYKTDKTSLSGPSKWEEVVARFEVMSTALLKHINPGKQTFRVSKTVTSSRLHEEFRVYLTEPELAVCALSNCTQVLKDMEVHCVVAELIPLIRNL